MPRTRLAGESGRSAARELNSSGTCRSKAVRRTGGPKKRNCSHAYRPATVSDQLATHWETMAIWRASGERGHARCGGRCTTKKGLTRRGQKKSRDRYGPAQTASQQQLTGAVHGEPARG